MKTVMGVWQIWSGSGGDDNGSRRCQLGWPMKKWGGGEVWIEKSIFRKEVYFDAVAIKCQHCFTMIFAANQKPGWSSGNRRVWRPSRNPCRERGRHTNADDDDDHHDHGHHDDDHHDLDQDGDDLDSCYDDGNCGDLWYNCYWHYYNNFLIVIIYIPIIHLMAAPSLGGSQSLGPDTMWESGELPVKPCFFLWRW